MKRPDWLPPKVSAKGNFYYYRPLRNGKRYKLCSTSASRRDVLLGYDAVLSELDGEVNFKKVVHEYLDSEEFNRLASKTQGDYISYSKEVIQAFGSMHPDAIETPHLVRWRNLLAKKRASHVQGNRHISFIGSVCRYGKENGHLKVNPSLQIKKLPERARTRYVTHHEYSVIYSHAPEILKIAMELAYVCMARITDVCELKKSNLREEGLFIQQSKTGVGQIKEWNERLVSAIKKASNLPLDKNMNSFYIIHHMNGRKIAIRTLQNYWEQARLDSLDECGFKSISEMDIHFHDLKSKGVSDMAGTLEDKRFAAGHTNIRQTQSYDRKLSVVPALKGDLAPITLPKFTQKRGE